ncbi:MAG: lysozyme inhibitor LprI family protein [Oxalicibacterium faecigallinarum]|uniref:lysozyme inhibitor LprI family protein n=1 Tax=Oxalicibacterium faecigallinarum TaxID=573741 RepID=UPI00280803B2|nr:lysozyme inhibitor LprI family protein [Oxalicibacterium faecigallinarum]MDQ7968076.1 lysozyme inhibitor LprI family protein [Oxalicibacterium faecigallinarum]
MTSWKKGFVTVSCTAALMLSSVSAMALDAETQEALKDCNKTQLSMNICASHRYAEADKALNQQYRVTMNSKDVNGKQRLRNAQRAWVQFRDKDCLASIGPRDASGSIWPLLQYTCLADHTEQRIESLKLQACGLEGCAK